MKKIVLGWLLSSGLFWAQTTKEISNFKVLKVYDNIEVELIHSPSSKVEILNAFESVDIQQKASELKIQFKNSEAEQKEKIMLKIFTPHLQEIEAHRGAVIKTGEKPIETEKIFLTAESSSKIRIHLKTNQLFARANAKDSEISVTGVARNQDISISDEAGFYGENIDSDNANVSVSVSGEVMVFASKSIKAITRAGGEIDIYGKPADRDTKKVVGGNIRFK